MMRRGVSYGPAITLLKLAWRMRDAAIGVCLDDIEHEFGVSRSTAERMLRTIGDLYHVETVPRDDDRRSFWRIRDDRPLMGAVEEQELVAELGHLAAAADLLREQGREEAAIALIRLGDRIRGAAPRTRQRAITTDLEAIMDAEGLVHRPRPRIQIAPGIVAALRHAIIACNKVRIRYRSQSTGGISWHKVCPYGFLYGARPYLVAFSRNPMVLDYRSYRLTNILEIEVLDEPYERDPYFSLAGYARNAFGVFQEEPFDVEWKFSPSVADEARQFIFHPDQTTEDLPDGSHIVRFRAGGAVEMAWHLCTWGDEVEVVKPQDFWERID